MIALIPSTIWLALKYPSFSEITFVWTKKLKHPNFTHFFCRFKSCPSNKLSTRIYSTFYFTCCILSHIQLLWSQSVYQQWRRDLYYSPIRMFIAFGLMALQGICWYNWPTSERKLLDTIIAFTHYIYTSWWEFPFYHNTSCTVSSWISHLFWWKCWKCKNIAIEWAVL